MMRLGSAVINLPSVSEGGVLIDRQYAQPRMASVIGQAIVFRQRRLDGANAPGAKSDTLLGLVPGVVGDPGARGVANGSAYGTRTRAPALRGHGSICVSH